MHTRRTLLALALLTVACTEVAAPRDWYVAPACETDTDADALGSESSEGESSEGDGGESTESSAEPAPEAEPDLLDLGGGTEYGEIPDTETETGEPAGPPCFDHWDCKDLSSNCGHGFCGLNGCEVLLFSEGLECIEDGVTGACMDGVCIV